MNDWQLCWLLQTLCSDDYAVLYAKGQGSDRSAQFCITYDEGFHQLPVHREDAVSTFAVPVYL